MYRRTFRAFTRNRFIAYLLLVILSATGRQVMAQGEWADDFALPGFNGVVNAVAVFDDGTGPALYVGGSFTRTASVDANNIAKWNGSAWSALGRGLGDGGRLRVVVALTVFDDGTGPALYAAGDFATAGGGSANNIAKWNGSTWSPLASGVNVHVYALNVFDDGTGSALYAAGNFTTAGGSSANGMAKWDGTSWSAVGSGLTGDVRAMTVFDDGTGPALYAGGSFTLLGGGPANGIAKWNGLVWSALPDAALGIGMNGTVFTLTVFDDGAGVALYAGGDFTAAGGISASGIARWNGSAWSRLDAGVSGGTPARSVFALAVFDDGTGPALHAAGAFTVAGGVNADRIAKWNGSAWSAMGTGLNDTVTALTVYDDGTGPALYAGGHFNTAGAVGIHMTARWNGSAWSALPDAPLGRGMIGPVTALTVFDDGTGAALYAGGNFTKGGEISVIHVARWNGTAWSQLGGGIDRTVFALTVFDDGTGSALYAGGDFTTAGEVSAKGVAKWNGSAWSALGSGVNFRALALTVFNDGTGPALYAGGSFSTAGGVSANNIAKWDGLTWCPLGSGTNREVQALAVFDDGTGPALYAGGSFFTTGGVSANNVARWNGSVWSPLGSGADRSVFALTVFDDGTGPALCAGGEFANAGDVSAKGIAKWNGSTWSALGDGVNRRGNTLTVFDDGTGPALYLGGEFGTAGSVVANRIARWDGAVWSALDSGMAVDRGTGGPVARVLALAVFDDGTSRTLYAGGTFTMAGAKRSNNIAAWRPDCTGNGIPNGCDVECGVACAAWSAMPGCGASEDFNGNRIPDECELFGDCNHNDVVDLGDGRIFAGCVRGPGVVVDALDACRCNDLNGDGFVDLRDAAEFVTFFGSSR